MLKRARWVFWMAAAVAASVLLPGGRPAWAGPARYDAETRSIRFTYTYAALAEGQFGEAAIGAPQTPSTEQDALVRTVVLKVSDALSKATGGRLKISSLDIVNDVRRADVVISLTGDPGRGGWAIPGAIEGRPGQIGLYYRTLAKEWEQDFVLTAAHEVCHYIFGLVDEYNFPNGCPVSNPGGPGCLMDNYLSQGTRHGWYGRLCATDHNTNPQQRQSCQDIVDKFFRDHGVTTLGAPGDDGTGGATNVLAKNDSIIENVTRATIARVREEAEAQNKDKKGLSSTAVSNFRTLARKFFEAQLKQNGITLGSDEVGSKVDGILRQTASVVRLAIPPRFDPIVGLIAKFAAARAREMREKYPKESELTRRQKVARALLSFVSGLGANAPTVDGPLTPDEKRYLDQVAMQAAIQTEDTKLNEELYDATMAHIKLDREIARNVLDIASEVGVVGMEKRIAAAGEVDADLRKYMPGRTASSGFGLRRTMIIDPDPIDPQNDFVVTQTGIYRNADLRDEYTEIFQRLLSRARIELLTTRLQERRTLERRMALGESAQERLKRERLRRLAELADRNRIRSQREAELRELLAEAIDQVRRNRLENILFVVPPGGIPAEMTVQFEALRRALIIKGDVRVDLLVMGAAEFPAPLRDICIGSSGSVVSLTSRDEVGSLAQRFKSEQTAGAWVITPHQDSIDPANLSSRSTSERWLVEDAKSGRFLDPEKQPIDLPSGLAIDWLEEIRRYFDPRHGPLRGASAARVDLELANRRPSDMITLLEDVVTENLTGSLPRRPRVELAPVGDVKGLKDELDYLTILVKRFNNRLPGTGDDLRFEIIEHVIRARNLENETRKLLIQVLDAHRDKLNPSYDEDELFTEAYRKTIGLDKRAQAGLSADYLAQVQPNLAAVSAIQAAPAPEPVPAATVAPREAVQRHALAAMSLVESAHATTLALPRPGMTLPTVVYFGSVPPLPPAPRAALPDRQPAPKEPAGATSPIPAPTPPSGGRVGFGRPPVFAQADVPDGVTLRELQTSTDPTTRRRIYTARSQWSKDHLPQSDRLRQGDDGNEKKNARAYYWNLFHVLDLLEAQAEVYRTKVLDDPSRDAELAPTIAYIELKEQEVRLRVVRSFLEHLSNEIASWGDKAPLFRRIDRKALVKANQSIADKAPGFVGQVPGSISRAPLPPVDTELKDSKGRPLAIRLARFYADNQRFDPTKGQAEFELILGFSQRLPWVDEMSIRDNDMDVLPELRLYNDNGQLANTPSLLLDRDVSTPTCLVYRFSPEFGETGWYTAGLKLNPRTRGQISDTIDFTFSVASTRPNFHLTALQLQAPNDPELIPPPPNRGLARAMDRRVKLQVQVYGGTSILGASVRGVLFKLDNGTKDIAPIAQDFFDDGKTYGDLKAEDGVYSSIISLDQVGGDNEGGGGIEYRVLIQAQSTETSRNIAPEDPNAGDDKRRTEARARGDQTVRAKGLDETKTPVPEQAKVFQRATSIEIRVER